MLLRHVRHETPSEMAVFLHQGLPALTINLHKIWIAAFDDHLAEMSRADFASTDSKQLVARRRRANDFLYSSDEVAREPTLRAEKVDKFLVGQSSQAWNVEPVR